MLKTYYKLVVMTKYENESIRKEIRLFDTLSDLHNYIEERESSTTYTYRWASKIIQEVFEDYECSNYLEIFFKEKLMDRCIYNF